MRGYAQSRAVHKQINLSHTGMNSIKIKQGVTEDKLGFKISAGKKLHISSASLKPKTIPCSSILTTPSELVSRRTLNFRSKGRAS